jgi:Domain of unknown function (DUF4405)
MTNAKITQRWLVNVCSFILFMVLMLTGLVNWLILPRGSEAGGALIAMRHFFREVHEWSALFFIIVMIIHLALHATHIKTNLKKHGLLK